VLHGRKGFTHENRDAGLAAAALIVAPFTIAPPVQAVPFATPGGSVTTACTDCLDVEAKTKDSPEMIAAKYGYPCTVASPGQQTPQSQNPYPGRPPLG
jgi:hypothetical protein